MFKILLTLRLSHVARDKNLFDSALNDVWRKALLVNASCENEKRPVGSRLTGNNIRVHLRHLTSEAHRCYLVLPWNLGESRSVR